MSMIRYVFNKINFDLHMMYALRILDFLAILWWKSYYGESIW